jgi:hypothetical protein
MTQFQKITIGVDAPGVDAPQREKRNVPDYSMFLITREAVMKNQLSLKFAALAVALLINGLIIGGVSYMFNGQINQRSGDDLVAHVQI